MKCARGAAPENLLNIGRGTFSLSRPAMRSFPRKSLRISMRASLGSTSILFIEDLSAFLLLPVLSSLTFLPDVFSDPCLSPFEWGICGRTHPSGDLVLWTSWSQCVLSREGWGWMENLRFFFSFLRLTILHYIYPNARFSFHIFLFTLKNAYYYCKSFLPTIGGLDPRVPPGSALLCLTVKLAPNFKLLSNVFN